MTLIHSILLVHVALAVTGFILGSVALTVRKRPGRHTRVGETYHWVMLGACVTACVMAILDWHRIRGYIPLAVGAYAFALLGYVAAKRRRPGWLRTHLIGQGGSYIGMITAIVVVNWKRLTGHSGLTSPWAWMLPIILGSLILAWVAHQVALGKRPKS